MISQIEKNNLKWHKMGSINSQCEAALTMTGRVKGTSQLKHYKELELKLLKFRCWTRRLCTMYKSEQLRSNITFHNLFLMLFIFTKLNKMMKASFHIIVRQMVLGLLSPHTPYQSWRNWICKFARLKVYYLSKHIFKKIEHPDPNPAFGINNPKGLNHLTKLWVGVSHLIKHKFKHNFPQSLTLYVLVV